MSVSNDELTGFYNRLSQLERRCTVLEDELSASRSAVVKLTDSVKDQRIDELVGENGRLRHRLQLVAEAIMKCE